MQGGTKPEVKCDIQTTRSRASRGFPMRLTKTGACVKQMPFGRAGISLGKAGPRPARESGLTSYVREIGSEILTAGGGSYSALGGSKSRGTNPNGAADT